MVKYEREILKDSNQILVLHEWDSIFKIWNIFKGSNKGVLSLAQSIALEIYEIINKFLTNNPNCGWWGWLGKKWKLFVLLF